MSAAERAGTITVTPRRLLATLLALTLTTGVVDAVSYLGLGRVFTANMTGNVVLLGFALGGAGGFSVPALAASAAGFVVGALGGGRLGRHLPAPPRGVVVPLALETALLAAAAALALGLAADTGDRRRYAVIAVVAAAMGLRNAWVRRLGVADLSTTVLTLTLTGLAADAHAAGGQGQRARRRAGAVVLMLAGAAVGAFLVRHSLSLPLALVAAAEAGIAAAYLAVARGAGGEPAW